MEELALGGAGKRRRQAQIMKGVTSEVIAEVRSRANILEVTAEHVVLKRAGKEHKGRCPFHDEKTPSFHVNADKGIYKCFGCGEGGDVFAFVQKIKGLDFIDSVRELARKYGVALVESVEERQQYDRRSAILMLYQQASQFYSHMLKDPAQGVIGRQYLEQRGLSDEIIDRFKLGYAPNSWDGLLRYLTQSTKVSTTTLEEAGLVRKRPDSNSYYDLFRNRLMIPICDEQGRVIAFGGRTLGDDQVKYLNSPETPIYTKGQHLFALNLAKDSIKAKDSVIVVEGYFDAITPHQFGFTNTVATLGTALTEVQAKSLIRFTESKRVYLAFDADAAGAKAVERGSETLNQIAEGIGIDLRVIHVEGGKDPDECLRSSHEPGEKSGAELFAAAIDQALPLVDYQLERAMAAGNASSHTGRIDASRRLVPILAQMKNAVARGEYIRQWALKLAVREEELLSDVGNYRREHRLDVRQSPRWQDRQMSAPRPRMLMKSGYIDAEQRLLALFLTSRDDYGLVKDALAEESLITPAHQRIKQAIEGIGTSFNTVEDLQYKVMDRLALDPEASGALVDVILKVEETRKENAPVHVLLFDHRVRLLKERLSRLQANIRTTMATASDEQQQHALQSKIIQLRDLEAKIASFSLETTLAEIDELSRSINEMN
jgi:DNA primase